MLSQPLCGPKFSFANKEKHCIVLVPLPTDLAYFAHSTYHLYEHSTRYIASLHPPLKRAELKIFPKSPASASESLLYILIKQNKTNGPVDCPGNLHKK